MMHHSGDSNVNDFVELRQVIGTLLKKWWVIAIFTLTAGVLAYVYTQSQTPIYQATTTVIVGQTISNRDVSSGDLRVSSEIALTYADVVRRYPVMQGAVDELGLDESWKSLRRRVDVMLVNDTQLLEISVEATTPEEAQAIADEIARQLIQLSPTSPQGITSEADQLFVQSRLDSLQDRIRSGEERLNFLEAIDISGASTEQILELQQQINALETLIVDWEANYASLLRSLEEEQSANYLAVIEPAQAGSSPVRPNLVLNMLIALVLGFSLAVILIFLLEFLDDTLKPGEDLQAILGVASLGSIGRIDGKTYQDKLLINQDPFSRAAEDYRLLRSKLQFMTAEGSQTFLVTSPLSKQGRSTTVANLGIVMAQAGLRTIIVDADLRRPMQHEIFQLPNEGGLGQLLRYPDLKPHAYLKRNVHVPDLKVLNSGALPPNVSQVLGGGLPPSPSELLGSQRMTRLLHDLGEVADVIIIDSPPAVSVADAAVLSNRVDGVLMVLETKRSKRETARQAVFNLQQARANIIGAVFNETSQRRFRSASSEKSAALVPQLNESGAQEPNPAPAKS